MQDPEKIVAKREYAKAFASAFAADLERASDLKKALIAGRIDRQGLTRIALRDLHRAERGYAGPILFPNIRRLVQTPAAVLPKPVAFGMGQIFEAITNLISTAAGAAASIYTASTAAAAKKKIAELELKRSQAEIQMAELQAKTAQAEYTTAETAARGAYGVPGETPTVLGVPWWGALLGVAAVGTVGYLALRPKGRR